MKQVLFVKIREDVQLQCYVCNVLLLLQGTQKRWSRLSFTTGPCFLPKLESLACTKSQFWTCYPPSS